MNKRGGVCRLCPLCRRPSAFCLACRFIFILFVLVLCFSLLMVAGLAGCWVAGLVVALPAVVVACGVVLAVALVCLVICL